jgi:sugar-specific transcriptional regulator TrmB
MPEQSRELMKRLGFSDDECSIYFKLLSSPQAIPIDKLLLESGMSTAQAEQAIRTLAERGAVKTVSNALEAVDPNPMLSRVLDEKRSQAEQMLMSYEETASALSRQLVPKYSESKLGIKPEDIVEPLISLEEMELQTVKIISNAQQEIKIFAETFGWYEKVREELFKAHDRGVKIRILMQAMDDSAQKRASELESLGIEVRHCAEEWCPVRGTLVDETELVFVIWATKKKGTPRPAFYRPHYTRNPGLTRVFSDAYRIWWQECKVKSSP